MPTEASAAEDGLAIEWNNYYKVDLDIRPYLDPNDEFFTTRPDKSHFRRSLEDSVSERDWRLSVAQNRKKIEERLQGKYENFNKLSNLLNDSSVRHSVADSSAKRPVNMLKLHRLELYNRASNTQDTLAEVREENNEGPHRKIVKRLVPRHRFSTPRDQIKEPQSVSTTLEALPKTQDLQANQSKLKPPKLKILFSASNEDNHITEINYGSADKLQEPSELRADTLDQIQKSRASVSASSSESGIDLSNLVKFEAVESNAKGVKKYEIPFRGTPMDKLKKKIISLAIKNGSNNIPLIKNKGNVKFDASSEVDDQGAKEEAVFQSATKKKKELVEEKVKLFEIQLVIICIFNLSSNLQFSKRKRAKNSQRSRSLK